MRVGVAASMFPSQPLPLLKPERKAVVGFSSRPWGTKPHMIPLHASSGTSPHEPGPRGVVRGSEASEEIPALCEANLGQVPLRWAEFTCMESREEDRVDRTVLPIRVLPPASLFFEELKAW